MAGVSHFLFYSMTIKEINDVIEVYNKRKFENLKDKAIMDYIQAQAIALFNPFSGAKQQDLKITKLYPNIFPELANKELLDEEERKKEAMLNFAQRFNEHLKIKNSKEEE